MDIQAKSQIIYIHTVPEPETHPEYKINKRWLKEQRDSLQIFHDRQELSLFLKEKLYVCE